MIFNNRRKFFNIIKKIIMEENSLTLKIILTIIDNPKLNDGFEKLDRDYLNIPIKKLIEKANLQIIKYCIFRGFNNFDQGLYWAVYFKKDDIAEYLLFEYNANPKYGGLAAIRYGGENFKKEADKYFQIIGESPFYDYNLCSFNYECDAEICKSGDIARFNAWIDYICTVSWTHKTEYLMNFLTSAIESENIEMVRYIMDNSAIKPIKHEEYCYRRLTKVLNNMINYPIKEIIDIIKYLFEHENIIDTCKYVLLFLLVKIKDWAYIKNIPLSFFKKRNDCDGALSFVIDRIIWFMRDEEFYNKMKINTVLYRWTMNEYIDILDEDGVINSFNDDYDVLLKVVCITPFKIQSY